MIKITFPDGYIKEYKKGTTLLEISKDRQEFFKSPIVEGVHNGVGTSLLKTIEEDSRVDFIDVDTEEGMRVYVRSLLFLFLAALNAKRPSVSVEVRNSLGSALYCIVKDGVVLSDFDLKDISDYMNKLIDKAVPICRKKISREEAVKICERTQMHDRIKLLDVYPDKTEFVANYLDGIYEYFYGPMLPNVSLLKKFELIRFEEGIVINYPDTGDYTRLDPWTPDPRLNSIYTETEEWSAMIGCNTVAKLNDLIKDGGVDGIIKVSEALHEKKIAGIADKIAENNKELKLVLIAGPSSSGKTSFAQRLSIQLAVNGIKPIPISMDDYYVNRTETPRKENGDFDFECIEAIDLVLFNRHISQLLEGETVKMPKYNFRTGMREYRGTTLTMEENSVLVVEGIHGLNEKLSDSIPDEHKMKIYISPLTPMSIDDFNRIQTTDMRLLRRMVRDSQFRSHDALMTLKLWSDVRAGEEKYIFPYQASADIIFNTTLIYEFAVLKKYAEPLLKGVPETEKEYTNAQRLLAISELVLPLDIDSIPHNSILREFVGGSAFKAVL